MTPTVALISPSKSRVTVPEGEKDIYLAAGYKLQSIEKSSPQPKPEEATPTSTHKQRTR